MSESKSIKYLPGHFLIAEVEMGDPNFHRTIVLMLEHNHEGAFGLVVNKETDISLGQVLENYADLTPGALPIYYGGPVEQQYLFTLHSGIPKPYQSAHILSPVPGVYFEPDFSLIDKYLRERWEETLARDRPDFRFYAGYSGWSPGQLERELDEDTWVTLSARSDLVFSKDPESAWQDALRKKGGIYWVAAETGFKPSVN
ncbi:MAG: YqgE/AlgH family protein [Spirochaetia bacterium]